MITTDKNDQNIKNITGVKWRLVYNDEKVLALIEGSENTVTSFRADFKSIEFETEKDALSFIEDNKLDISDYLQSDAT